MTKYDKPTHQTRNKLLKKRFEFVMALCFVTFPLAWAMRSFWTFLVLLIDHSPWIGPPALSAVVDRSASRFTEYAEVKQDFGNGTPGGSKAVMASKRVTPVDQATPIGPCR